MLPFKRFYTASAIILCVSIALSVIGGIESGLYGVGFSVIFLLVALVALFPIFWRGGILENLRLSISIAAIFTIATGSMVALEFLDFVQTGGGEGPNGEGSPLANMIALALGTAIVFCPWLLTTLRGIPHWNKKKTIYQSPVRSGSQPGIKFGASQEDDRIHYLSSRPIGGGHPKTVIVEFPPNWWRVAPRK